MLHQQCNAEHELTLFFSLPITLTYCTILLFPSFHFINLSNPFHHFFPLCPFVNHFVCLFLPTFCQLVTPSSLKVYPVYSILALWVLLFHSISFRTLLMHMEHETAHYIPAFSSVSNGVELGFSGYKHYTRCHTKGTRREDEQDGSCMSLWSKHLSIHSS